MVGGSEQTEAAACAPSSTPAAFSNSLANTLCSLKVYSRRRGCSRASSPPPRGSPPGRLQSPESVVRHQFMEKVTKQIVKLLPKPPTIHKRRSKGAPPDSLPRRSRRIAGANPCSPGPVVSAAQKRVIRGLGLNGSEEISHKAQDDYRSIQGLIMNKGGARLLANVASKTDDLQTLRMVAGAIANLCGNEKLHVMLKQDGGIKALIGMFQTGQNDVIAQIARGIANFAKCESRVISQGHRKGRSLLIEDGVLSLMVANSTAFSASTRRHIELAFCHLAQNEENARDIILTGGIKELLRISRESSRDDARNLAKKALNSNPAFLKEIQ